MIRLDPCPSGSIKSSVRQHEIVSEVSGVRGHGMGGGIDLCYDSDPKEPICAA